MTNYKIDYQCPQCGAPAVLEETDRLFSCEFCRVKSYLLEPGYFRYVLPHSVKEDTPLFYFPYWRFKGLYYSCHKPGPRHRLVDVSHQAIRTTRIPISLGLRTQALKLKFLTPEIKGRFLKPVMTKPELMNIIRKRLPQMTSAPIIHEEFIGEATSLIYAPFYEKDHIMDAVLNKPVHKTADDDFLPQSCSEDCSFPPIRFVPAICPDCGWDLSGNRDSIAMTCSNCHSVWKARRGKLTKLSFGFLPGTANDTMYLPFWRIQAGVSGASLNTFEDLVKLANLPVVLQGNRGKDPFYFWTPAFKMHPKNFLHVGRLMINAQIQETLIPKIPDKPLYPVSLQVAEAVESLMIFLSILIVPKHKLEEQMAQIRIHPKKYLLVFVPFQDAQYELVQPKYFVAINKTMLNLSKNL